MRIHSLTSLVAATITATAVLSGCTPPANDKGAGGQPAVKTQALDCGRDLSTDDVLNYPVPKANKPYRITLLMISLAGYYYNGVVWGAKQAAEQAGVDLSVVAAQGFATAPEQITQAENALTRGTDAIVLNPVDVNASAPIVDMASQRGVPTIVVGTMVNTDKAAGQIVQDDYKQGQAAADALAQRLPNGGKGILMAGPANATWAVGRATGFKDRLKEKYPNLTISSTVNSNVDPGEGLAKFTNATSSTPQVDWIYTATNLLLPPASIPAQYKKAVLVAGGLDPSTHDAVASGEAAVIPDWPVNVGYIGIAEAVNTLNGTPAGKLTCLPSPVVSADELDTPLGQKQFYPWKVS